MSGMRVTESGRRFSIFLLSFAIAGLPVFGDAEVGKGAFLEVTKTTNDTIRATLFAPTAGWSNLLDCPIGERVWKQDIFAVYKEIPTNATGIVTLKLHPSLNEFAPMVWLKPDVMRVDFDNGVILSFHSHSPHFKSVDELNAYVEQRVEPVLKEKVGEWTVTQGSEGLRRLEFTYGGSRRILDIRPVAAVGTSKSPRYHLTFCYCLKPAS